MKLSSDMLHGREHEVVRLSYSGQDLVSTHTHTPFGWGVFLVPDCLHVRAV